MSNFYLYKKDYITFNLKSYKFINFLFYMIFNFVDVKLKSGFELFLTLLKV